jgi:hypothetical protein
MCRYPTQHQGKGATVTLGDRCDEIVRLIDETLGGLTTPVPARQRRMGAEPAVATIAGGEARARRDLLAFDPDAGPSAA